MIERKSFFPERERRREGVIRRKERKKRKKNKRKWNSPVVFYCFSVHLSSTLTVL